jgi:uncharacterized protein YndB with AHSA1/START domain
MAELLLVRHELVVRAPVERCFDVFTDGLGSWWPLQPYAIGQSPAKTCAMEPRVGGRWYEVGEDGTECTWGHVKVWDPPHQVVLGWEIDAQWQPDPDSTSEVDVRFTAVDDGSTRVELEHRGFEYYGDAAEQMRDGVGGDTGWPWLLQAFAQKAA